MKSLLSIRYLYKISSKRLAKANWDMELSRNEALTQGELVSLASSTTLRMIDKINGQKDIEAKIQATKKEINGLKKDNNNKTSSNKMKRKYGELNKLTFMEDYLMVIMENNKHYDRAIKGFKVNGIEYVRLLATSGGVKKSTIVFVSKRIHDKLYTWINNDRDMDKQFVPAKLEAYLSLSCSASTPVSNPNGVLVVHDIETKFKDNVVVVDGLKGGRPVVEDKDDYECVLNACDGMGLMTPKLSQRWSMELGEDYMTTGVCLRNAFCKGMVYTFDFQAFAEEIAQTNMVKDVWGNEHNISDIEIVLTTSMLKLWDSYKSIDHYLACCEKNNYEFALTKVIPEELDNEQTLNYQFLQSLDLTKEDIKELCRPTLEEIDGIMNLDYRKALLYLRGINLSEKNVSLEPYDISTAIMVDKDMAKDPYVFSKIKAIIKNRINEAKLGVLTVRGNFSLVSGDPYILCESMFGLEPKGLLKSGEFYSKYWIDRNVTRVVGMRAPQTNGNNIVIRNICSNEQTSKWYKYMKCVTIFNAWDNTCSSLNGADFD